jgi:hypothetical protein
MGSEVDTTKQWLQDYCTALKYGRWVQHRTTGRQR